MIVAHLGSDRTTRPRRRHLELFVYLTKKSIGGLSAVLGGRIL
jgi:hypothetical protein